MNDNFKKAEELLKEAGKHIDYMIYSGTGEDVSYHNACALDHVIMNLVKARTEIELGHQSDNENISDT